MRHVVAAIGVLLLAGCTGGDDDPIRLRYNGLAFEDDVCGPPVNATVHLFSPDEGFDDVRLVVSVDGERVTAQTDEIHGNTAWRPKVVFEELDLCGAAGKRHVEVRATAGDEVLVGEVADVSVPRARVTVVRVDAGPGPCGNDNETIPLSAQLWNGAQHATGRAHVIVDSIYGTWDGWTDRISAQENATVDGRAYPRPSCGEGATAPLCVSSKADNGPVAVYLGQLTRRGEEWVVEGLRAVQEPCYSWVALGED